MTTMRRLAIGAVLLLLIAPSRAHGQGSIAGMVYDSLRTNAPLAHATVVLIERGRYATTDARGRFRIDGVPDGRYTVGFSHAMLDSLDLQLPLVGVTLSGAQRASIALATPSPQTLYRRLCPDGGEADLGVIVGVVRDVDTRQPLAGAIVSTEWSEFRYTARGTTRDSVRAVATADAQGVFRLCHVPVDVPLDLIASGDAARAGPVPVVLDLHRYGRADFAISLRDHAAAVATGTTASPMRGTAAWRGVLRTPDGGPASNATVRVAGSTRATRTDSAGAFALEFIPAGTRTLEVRAIGAEPTSVVVDFATGGVRDTALTLRRPAPTLARVAVTANAPSNSLMVHEGFEGRRRQGLGAFLAGDVLARVRTTQLASTLASVRGVKVEYGAAGYPMPYLRGMKGGTCIPNYFVDGVAFAVDGAFPAANIQHPFSDLSDAILAERIRGIEVYASPGGIPVQYDLTSSTGCGSIVIWTR